MLNKLRAVESRYEELCAKSEQPDFYADPQKAAKLLRERNDLEPIIEAFRASYLQAEILCSSGRSLQLLFRKLADFVPNLEGGDMKLFFFCQNPFVQILGIFFVFSTYAARRRVEHNINILAKLFKILYSPLCW